jgi:hypothetical protein
MSAVSMCSKPPARRTSRHSGAELFVTSWRQTTSGNSEITHVACSASRFKRPPTFQLASFRALGR